MKENDIPLVSIVTITFNLINAGRKDYFIQNLESVHKQKYPRIEHLIIDGASTDGTVELLEEYEKKGWITYISEKDSGIYDAMNKGVINARGEFISFLNSDDYYHNMTGVSTSIKAILKSGADFSYAPVINKNEETQVQLKIKPDITRVFYILMPNHQTMFFRRKILMNAGLFNIKYRYIADYDMTLRLCLNKHRSVYVARDFVTYRLGGLSESATNDGSIGRELQEIYFTNYQKYCPITYDECSVLCRNIYWGEITDFPVKLAEALKEHRQYFKYKNYIRAIALKANTNSFRFKLIRFFKQTLRPFRLLIPESLRPTIRKFLYKLFE